jgi:hypothetical protein
MTRLIWGIGRKTYIGAMPGKIIFTTSIKQSLRTPFLIDEIDKINSDFSEVIHRSVTKCLTLSRTEHLKTIT